MQSSQWSRRQWQPPQAPQRATVSKTHGQWCSSPRHDAQGRGRATRPRDQVCGSWDWWGLSEDIAFPAAPETQWGGGGESRGTAHPIPQAWHLLWGGGGGGLRSGRVQSDCETLQRKMRKKRQKIAKNCGKIAKQNCSAATKPPEPSKSNTSAEVARNVSVYLQTKHCGKSREIPKNCEPQPPPPPTSLTSGLTRTAAPATDPRHGLADDGLGAAPKTPPLPLGPMPQSAPVGNGLVDGVDEARLAVSQSAEECTIHLPAGKTAAGIGGWGGAAGKRAAGIGGGGGGAAGKRAAGIGGGGGCREKGSGHRGGGGGCREKGSGHRGRGGLQGKGQRASVGGGGGVTELKKQTNANQR